MKTYQGYIKGRKTRKAEKREIKTLIFNALINTEKIGLKTIRYDTLLQRVGEHLEELRLNYTRPLLESCLDEMVHDDQVYRVSSNEGIRIGRVI